MKGGKEGKRPKRKYDAGSISSQHLGTAGPKLGLEGATMDRLGGGECEERTKRKHKMGVSVMVRTPQTRTHT